MSYDEISLRIRVIGSEGFISDAGCGCCTYDTTYYDLATARGIRDFVSALESARAEIDQYIEALKGKLTR